MHQREESVSWPAVTCPKGSGDAGAMSMSKTVASLRKSSAERVDESCNSLSDSESSSSGVGKSTMQFLAAHVWAGAIYSASESGASSHSRDSFSAQRRVFRRLLRHMPTTYASFPSNFCVSPASPEIATSLSVCLVRRRVE